MLKEYYFHKYLKNILILPIIFSKNNDQSYIFNLLIGFYICLINYVVYTTNDYLINKIDKK